MNYSEIFCIRFDFGVPLEDIFPPDGIHPRLHNLLYQTRVAFMDSSMTLTQILNGSYQEPFQEKLKLKEKMVKGKICYEENKHPVAFFWLLRHFLKLLPLPLFPKFTVHQEYNWLTLAKQCKLCRIKRNPGLDSDIFWCIYRLPRANILMIDALITFLRRITSQGYPVKRFHKDSVVAAVRYFCSSLFLRPYLPGIISEQDDLYYPLMFYLIVHWYRIKRHTLGKYQMLNQLHSIPENVSYNKIIDSRHLTSIPEYPEMSECSCQTNSWLTYLECSNMSTLESFSKNNKMTSEKTVKTSECGCQTSCWLLTNYLDKLDKNSSDLLTKSKLDSVSTNIDETSKDFYHSQPSLIKSHQEIERNASIPLISKEVYHSEHLCRDNKSKGILSENVLSHDVVELERSFIEDSALYDSVVQDKTEIKHSSYLNSDSTTAIYEKEDRHILKRKMLKVSKSFSSALSKLNSRIKGKQEITKSNSRIKLNAYKYNLLEDSNDAKVQVTRGNSFSNAAPSIAYKKLLTL